VCIRRALSSNHRDFIFVNVARQNISAFDFNSYVNCRAFEMLLACGLDG
jgi:hypothetical protein